MKKIDLLNERSDFINEVLERPPNAIITWGNTFFLFFLILILLLSWFIKYPDIIVSEITLTTDRPPVFLTTKVSGRIDSLIKKNNENVKIGDWVAIVESDAILEDVYFIKNILDRIAQDKYAIEEITSINFPVLNLGKMQPEYNKLVRLLGSHLYNRSNDKFDFQKKLNEIQINEYNILISTSLREKQVAEKELKVTRKLLERNKILLEKGVISYSEFEGVELTYLQAIRSLENSISRISQIKSEKVSLQSKGKGLVYDKQRIFFNSELEIHEALKLMELAFIQWVKEHVLISTVEGKVVYLDFIVKNHHVSNDENLISIVPNYKKSDYFGVAKMPILNSGKVKLKQKVNVKLARYPEKEFGMILGEIENISELPNKNEYFVKVRLTNGLNTTYDKNIEFKQNIKGSAEIITEDIRLIERFVYTLIKPFYS